MIHLNKNVGNILYVKHSELGFEVRNRNTTIADDEATATPESSPAPSRGIHDILLLFNDNSIELSYPVLETAVNNRTSLASEGVTSSNSIAQLPTPSTPSRCTFRQAASILDEQTL